MVPWTEDSPNDDDQTDEKPPECSRTERDRGENTRTDDDEAGTTEAEATEAETPPGGGDEESTASVGSCPDCDTSLPQSNVLIEYETGAEWQQVARCPECEDLAVAQ